MNIQFIVKKEKKNILRRRQKQKVEGGPKKCYQPLCQRQQKNIGATIRIGQEIWCLPYAGFLMIGIDNFGNNTVLCSDGYLIIC